MKKYLIIFATVLIGGAFTWSCSQDDLNDGQPIYRYSAEQLAEIRALAEKYDVPEVKYATVSEKGLPSVNEMEQTFQLFSNIKSSLAQPMEVLESTEGHVCYRTRHPLFKRTYVDGEGYTGDTHIETSYNVPFESGYAYSCWLIIDVSWENASASNRDVEVKAELELGAELSERVEKGREKTEWKWVGATGIDLSYSCNLNRKGSTSTQPYYTVEYKDVITIH